MQLSGTAGLPASSRGGRGPVPAARRRRPRSRYLLPDHRLPAGDHSCLPGARSSRRPGADRRVPLPGHPARPAPRRRSHRRHSDGWRGHADGRAGGHPGRPVGRGLAPRLHLYDAHLSEPYRSDAPHRPPPPDARAGAHLPRADRGRQLLRRPRLRPSGAAVSQGPG